jgi:hypothetical protein
MPEFDSEFPRPSAATARLASWFLVATNLEQARVMDYVVTGCVVVNARDAVQPTCRMFLATDAKDVRSRDVDASPLAKLARHLVAHRRCRIGLCRRSGATGRKTRHDGSDSAGHVHAVTIQE